MTSPMNEFISHLLNFKILPNILVPHPHTFGSFPLHPAHLASVGTLTHLGKGNLNAGTASIGLTCAGSVGVFPRDCSLRAQIPWVLPCSVKKAAEQSKGASQHTMLPHAASVPPLGSCLEFLPSLPSRKACNLRTK